MHVAVLTYHFLPRLGGVEVATHELACALTRCGVEVSVIAPRQLPEPMELPYRLVPLQGGSCLLYTSDAADE